MPASAFSARSQARFVTVCRRYYGCGARAIRKDDPAAHLAMPAQAGLPKTLSVDQVDRLLTTPAATDVLGLRDRAMLELMYASGLRVSELVKLRHDEINLEHGVVRLIGKGGKDGWCRPAKPRSMRCAPGCPRAPGTARTRIGRLGIPDAPRRGDDTPELLAADQRHAVAAGIHRGAPCRRIRYACVRDPSAGTRCRSARGAGLCSAMPIWSTTQIYTHVARARLKNSCEASSAGVASDRRRTLRGSDAADSSRAPLQFGTIQRPKKS